MLASIRLRRWAMRATSVATGVAIAASISSLAGTASASPPVAVSIQATVTQFSTFSGVYQASGAINDSGTFVRTDLHLTGSVPNSPVVGAFQVVLVFSSSQGTFTVRDELLGTTTGLTGQWQIESGTGVYDRISGHGTSEFVPPNHTLFTGVISIAG
jgi:hypothetical protein